MNSYDPWRVMQSAPPGSQMIVPPPFYGHQFYGDSTHGGTFVGAIPSGGASERSGLTATFAPVLAPATGPITAKFELDDKQVLRATICVDGKCHASSMDLAPAIAAILARVATYHDDLHRQMAPASVSGSYVVGCVDRAVAAAGQEMVGHLVDRHVATACGSFLDDIGNAVSSFASPVISTVTSTLKQFKGPIAAAASAAAMGGAAMIPGVGAFAAPLAGKLAGDLVNSTLGDPQAQQAVAQAQQAAKTDPTAAVALDEAKKAVAHSTVAHHVHHMGHRAAAGHPGAQQQVQQVVADAQKGDPVAQEALKLLPQLLSQFGVTLPSVG